MDLEEIIEVLNRIKKRGIDFEKRSKIAHDNCSKLQNESEIENAILGAILRKNKLGYCLIDYYHNFSLKENELIFNRVLEFWSNSDFASIDKLKTNLQKNNLLNEKIRSQLNILEMSNIPNDLNSHLESSLDDVIIYRGWNII